jgi:excisionase family DNA binding protein
MEQNYHSVTEIAKRWGVSNRLVQQIIERKELEATRIGSVWRVSIESLMEYEKKNSNRRPGGYYK